MESVLGEAWHCVIIARYQICDPCQVPFRPLGVDDSKKEIP
jgi:hypothetical protein